ncbi:Hypothetical_protein [Hexamita inflata]|uniref:Hypothetical_protein n=1 Tax=Hexamita inflata TaxID=28002 RepID=A0AA86U2M3_9EUKA|nr:Hypothetical protein HINF_LOCUS23492 [Hexamita inflata]
MIFAVTLAAVLQMMQAPGSAILGYQFSNDNVLDYTSCTENYYQVMFDGTVQMKGMLYGLLNSKSLDFVEVDIKQAQRVFCIQDKFMYLTLSGKLMKEDAVQAGKLTFTQVLPLKVLDIQSTADTIFVLTTDGFFIQQKCQNYICGMEDTYFPDLQLVNYPLTSKIASFSIERQVKNIIFYLENGDVYLTGKTQMFPIIQDSDPIRKIGSGFKSVYLGWNSTIAQNVMYYQRGNDLVMYSNTQTQNEQVIKMNVQDFGFYEQFVMIKENHIEIYQENANEATQFSDIFCDKYPTDLICIKIAMKTYKQADCPSDSLEIVCKLNQCWNHANLPDCTFTLPCQNNYTCWALWCKQNDQITKNTQQCYINQLTSTSIIPLQNSKASYFRNSLLFTQNIQQKNKISSGSAAGIAVAACVVVFVLIITIVIVQMKKKQVNAKIIIQESSAEVALPELTTAQSIEVQ